ncbi:MAG: DEAD/DEAH box helicase [Candidatus Woesearchaeota archaeon]
MTAREKILEFHGFKLDRFQIEAIESIENNHSVVVSAATGTGKTLIADYVIDKYLKEGKHIIYTAPIKALSNQKYRDFKAQYGEEKVGILTGDVTINPAAPLKIMTTEIYRNMLLAKDSDVENLSYVIFDEIHYLGDIERGTVWEESIIFSKESTRFLCLSATIPNAKQFANWISYIKKHPVDVVTEKKRAVPLEHRFYDDERGFATLDEIAKWKKLDEYPKYHQAFKMRKKMLEESMRRKKRSFMELLRDLEDEKALPTIYFCFSRLLTQKKAEVLQSKKNYLTSKESMIVAKLIREKIDAADPAVRSLRTTQLLRECLQKGIAFHHAGVLAVLKELVEELFSAGFVKVLFATETFAVGINMPAKTVCFDSLEKFDGINFRYVTSKEYFQLAGRAGRRGIDTKGLVVTLVERNFADISRMKRITQGDSEPLESQFKLSYNTVLNLIHSHTLEQQKIILESSFYSYQKEGKSGSQQIMHSFMKRKKKLMDEGHIVVKDNKEILTEKGRFTTHIYTEELLVSNIFSSSLTPQLSPKEILIIAGAIVYEERKNIAFRGEERGISNEVYRKVAVQQLTARYLHEKKMHTLEPFLKSWYMGCEFLELMKYTTMLEGDIVRFIRQILDLLQQIMHATRDNSLRDKLSDIARKIDRDVIAVRF